MAPTDPKLVALNKLGEIRNQNPTLYQVIEELKQKVNEYILEQAALAPVTTTATPYSALFAQTANGATVSNTVTTTSILGTGTGSLSIPAGRLVVGSTIRLLVGGIVSSGAGDTISVAVKSGANTIGGFAGLPVPLIAQPGFQYLFEATVRTVGSSGSIQSSEGWLAGYSGGTFQTFLSGTLGTIDTTTAQAIDVLIAWSAANASSTITAKVAVLEVF